MIRPPRFGYPTRQTIEWVLINVQRRMPFPIVWEFDSLVIPWLWSHYTWAHPQVLDGFGYPVRDPVVADPHMPGIIKL